MTRIFGWAKPFALIAFALALFTFGQNEARADDVFIAGFTNGCYGAGCTPGSSASVPGLSYSNATFSGTTANGFRGLGGNANPGANVNNLGSFTLSTAANTFNTPFTLQITFTAPQGINGSATITMTAVVTGTVRAADDGGILIDFDNTPQLFTFNDTNCGATTVAGQQTTCGSGSFFFAALDVALDPGQTTSLNGYVSGAQQTSTPPAAAGQLLISEFRLRGPSGADDEFIEIYNASGASHTVAATSGTGYGIAASDGATRCSIPNGTVIPDRGHYLCVNSSAYSLASYPAASGTTATGDATYTLDIPDNAGIALFNNNSGGVNYSLANRIDAAGSSSEANTLYKEGNGYPALTSLSTDYSFYRDNCGKGGSITTFGKCSISTPKDSDDNGADFIFVNTTGTPVGTGPRLGAPGPENLSSPIQRNSTIGGTLLDPCVGESASPNRARDTTSDPANNSTFGTLDIRRTFTNSTGGAVTRLRFRIIDITTYPAPGVADLRARSSSSVVVTVDRPPCDASATPITVLGTTLEQPPTQTIGGGFNSSLSAGTITLAAPLASGASIDLRFQLGVEKTGNFKFYVNIEALP